MQKWETKMQNAGCKDSTFKSKIQIINISAFCIIIYNLGNAWGCSSVGRAPALHAGGHRFEPVHLHHRGATRLGLIAQLVRARA